MKQLPRLSLAQLPTPIEDLPRATRRLGGARLFVKRDDLAGRGLGGNKTRKLEFLLADALEQGADIVLTAGATQSNHCRLTVACAAQAGLDCGLVLGGHPPSSPPQGNLLLDTLMGAQIFWCGSHRRGEDLELIADRLRSEGRQPYIVPYGGSNALGAAGYVLAMRELAAQDSKDFSLRAIDRIVFATSSGATQAGLAAGARAVGYQGQVLGIGIDREVSANPAFPEQLATLTNGCAELLGISAGFNRADFTVNLDYLGDGYGVVGQLEREAIQLMATAEGLLIDPVYTGRAVGGLIDMIRRGIIGQDENILFWHTGGIPALFAYNHALV